MQELCLSSEEFNPKVLFHFRAKARNTVPDHQHDFLSIHYIVSGDCTYHIDGVEYAVRKDDLIILNPGTDHHQTVSCANSDATVFYLGVDNLFIRGCPKNIIPVDCPIVHIKKYSQELYNSYHEIMNTHEKKDTCWELMAKVLALQFLVILFKELSHQSSSRLQDYFHFETYDKTTIAQTITKYFQENYMKKISVDDIARSTYLSTTYITKIYKEVTGDTPINYLINLRLEKARDILEEGHFSIQAVAKKVGYDDPYYFSKLFKKKFGCSPSSYKRKGDRSQTA